MTVSLSGLSGEDRQTFSFGEEFLKENEGVKHFFIIFYYFFLLLTVALHLDAITKMSGRMESSKIQCS